MSRKQFKPAMKCIFGDSRRTTRTHVFPDWLNRAIELPDKHWENIRTPVGRGLSAESHFRIKQGSIFSQKPYLTCEACNCGWMKKFEDEMLKFSVPIFTAHEPVVIGSEQMRILAGWISLITLLSEFLDRHQPPTIPIEDRLYIKEKLEPPSSWSIFVASLDGYAWRGAKRRFTKIIRTGEAIFESQFAEETQKEMENGLTPNSQVSSFGIGNLFIQVFTTPAQFLIGDYRVAADRTGLVQIWPIPMGLWPFTKRTVKFPTKLVLTDECAEKLATAYRDRIDQLIPKKLDYAPKRGRH